MLRRSLLTVATTTMLVLSGCAGDGAGTVARYSRRASLEAPKAAPADASYGLYSPADVTPKAIYALKKGEKLGFVRRDDKLFAVAGTNELPIQTSDVARSFEWRQMKR